MKKKNIVIIGIVLILVVVGVFLFFKLRKGEEPEPTPNKTNGNEVITKAMENKEDGIIYYYNSKSSNKHNLEIKEYLDELKINYYAYDDANVDKEEYKKFLELTDIPEDLFGMPAIIYINDGIMWGNLINIEDKEVVKRFLDDYDLYTVK